MSGDTTPNGHDPEQTTEGLERLGLKELIAEGERRLREYCGDQTWIADPLVVHGPSDHRALNDSGAALMELEQALGRKLVGDAVAVADDDTFRAIGRNALEGLYEKELREHERMLDLYRRGAWEELHRAGFMSEDECQVYRQEFPDGNPDYRP